MESKFIHEPPWNAEKAADLHTVADINELAEFLSDSQLHDLSSSHPVDCIIICASAVLHSAEVLFQTLTQNPSLTKCLVLCGGLGHSTPLLYDAVKQHPRFSPLSHEIQNMPEARVLERILDRFYDRPTITREGCQILIEDRSTNCGQNALFSRQVLDKAGFTMKTCIVIQDPTMMRRTRASFEKVYEDTPVSFVSCPVFVPRMKLSHSGLEYSTVVDPSTLWSESRFLELILGEVPRLRDDEEGYGPKGRGFISHVDVPSGAEMAWSRLVDTFRDFRQM